MLRHILRSCPTDRWRFEPRRAPGGARWRDRPQQLEQLSVEATEVTGEERDELYRRLARMRPAFAGYEEKTDRVIPMFGLTRIP